MNEPPFDVAKAHRWFAVELNNAAWDLVDKADRTAAETDQMIHSAHAACLHWSQVGASVNRLRAEVLLALVYVEAGQGEPAVHSATRCMGLLEPPPADLTPFDIASVHGAASRAHALTGADDEAKRHQEAMKRAAEGMDKDELAVLRSTFGLK